MDGHGRGIVLPKPEIVVIFVKTAAVLVVVKVVAFVTVIGFRVVPVTRGGATVAIAPVFHVVVFLYGIVAGIGLALVVARADFRMFRPALIDRTVDQTSFSILSAFLVYFFVQLRSVSIPSGHRRRIPCSGHLKQFAHHTAAGRLYILLLMAPLRTFRRISVLRSHIRRRRHLPIPHGRFSGHPSAIRMVGIFAGTRIARFVGYQAFRWRQEVFFGRRGRYGDLWTGQTGNAGGHIGIGTRRVVCC